MLRGKVGLVTGAGSGIGRAAAIAMAREGCRLIVSNRNQASGEATAKAIRDAGGEAVFVRADVTQPKDVAAMVAAAVKTYGRLDCAFNNAGVEGELRPMSEITEEQWDTVIGTNLRGVLLCLREEFKAMARNKSGSIVNCSSVAGLIGIAGAGAYVASKHGVIGLTKTASLEGARMGVRVNAVCPGVIKTPMIDRVIEANPDMEAALRALHPLNRFGTPEEVAEAVVWLCSDRASFVTGASVPVDGGWTVS